MHWEAPFSNIHKTEARGIGRLNFINNVRIRFVKYNFKGGAVKKLIAGGEGGDRG